MDDELQAGARAAIPPRARDQSGESSPESYRAPHEHRKLRQSDSHRDSHRDRKRQRYLVLAASPSFLFQQQSLM